VQDAQFGYQEQEYPVFSGAKADVEGDWQQNQDSGEILAETEWVQEGLPGQISFMVKDPENGFMVREVISQSPPLNHQK
jgi:hypothetical protein